MSKREPLYPHVTKGSKGGAPALPIPRMQRPALQPKSFSTRLPFEQEEEERTPQQRAADEKAIKDAQDVVTRVRQVAPQLQKIYDATKYKLSGGEWTDMRKAAAEAFEALGHVETEAMEQIKQLRAKR